MIVVVVVTHAAEPAMLHACVRSVVLAGGAGGVVLIDNGGTVDLPHDLAEQVRVVRSATNKGFGAAVNLGVVAARDLGAASVVVLNDDVVVGPGWLEPLAAALAGPRVGAAQPVLCWHSSIGPEPTVNSAGVRLDRYGAGTDLLRDEPPPAVDAPPFEVPLFTGGAVLLDLAFVDEVGGFDERYFLYYEDVDLGLRGAEHGWRYLCVPASRVGHHGSATTARTPELAAFLRERNRLWCLFRFADPATIGRGVWLSLRRLRVHPRRIHLRALGAGLAGMPTRVAERRRARAHHGA